MTRKFEHLNDENLQLLHELLSRQFVYHQKRLSTIQAQLESVLATMKERGIEPKVDNG